MALKQLGLIQERTNLCRVHSIDIGRESHYGVEETGGSGRGGGDVDGEVRA